jgi:hypothetical protein
MASIANTITHDVGCFIIVPTAPAIVGSGNITAASPAVVTIASHGLVTGDYVTFAGILQANWTALNGNAYEITKLTANTFSIAVNSSAFGAYTDAAGTASHSFYGGKYFPLGVRITAILFQPSAASDIFRVRHDSFTGTKFGGPLKNALSDPVKEYFLHGQKYIPCFKIYAGDCVFETPANVEIKIEYM